MAAQAASRLGVLSRQLTSASGQDSAGFFSAVPQAPADAILGITQAFQADADERRLNLGVGAYRTEEGKPLVLASVRTAEQRIAADTSRNKEYLPMGGLPRFCELSRRLAFGADCPASAAGRVATVQTLSGTGALRVGGEFLKRHHGPGTIVYLPNPSWANHANIFANWVGLEVRRYRYFDAASRGLDYEGLLQDLRAAPPGSVVLLHACAHNPSGCDPTLQQWRGILAVVQERRLLPFFDSAYQGFASGDLDADAAALRLFTAAGIELLLATSFAKNLGLYAERVGALSVVAASADAAKRVRSQLEVTARGMYSSPPLHGAAIVVEVLGDPQLYSQWRTELAGMAGRIKDMRAALHDALVQAGAPGDWQHILTQIGMFSYTGLTKAQCERMTSRWHVYLTLDGRISMAGLSRSRVAYLAAAIKDCVTNA